jgi:hypothetical protein
MFADTYRLQVIHIDFSSVEFLPAVPPDAPLVRAHGGRSGIVFIYASYIRGTSILAGLHAVLARLGLSASLKRYFTTRKGFFPARKGSFLTWKGFFSTWKRSFTIQKGSFSDRKGFFLTWKESFLIRKGSFSIWERSFLTQKGSFLTWKRSFTGWRWSAADSGKSPETSACTPRIRISRRIFDKSRFLRDAL